MAGYSSAGRGHVLWVVLALAGLLSAMTVDAARGQGRLQAFRADVRTPPPPDPHPAAATPPKKERKKSRHDCSRDDYYDGEEDAEDLVGNFLGAMIAPSIVASLYAAAGVATSPFWGPAKLIHDDYDFPGQFGAYPYANHMNGYLRIDLTPHPFTYPWSLRVRSEYANDLNDMSAWSTNVLLESTARLGLDTTVDYRRESLGQGAYDNLWTGDVNLVFRFAQSEQLIMRSGIGVTWLSDTDETNIGFNFTYGGDWFPRRPWVISSVIDWGRIGHATLFHGRATIGVNYRHCELYTGFDYYGLGATHTSGLVAGVGFWY